MEYLAGLIHRRAGAVRIKYLREMLLSSENLSILIVPFYFVQRVGAVNTSRMQGAPSIQRLSQIYIS